MAPAAREGRQVSRTASPPQRRGVPGSLIKKAEIEEHRKGPLFRTASSRRQKLTTNRLHRTEALLRIKQRTKSAGLPPDICCHTFQATGITVYLENGGTLEKAQQMAAHESARTTKLYDRTQDKISLDEVERIVI